MFSHLPSANALRAFEAAGRHASFAAAADELKVSAGTISYHIKQLETALGTALFDRRIRQVTLTDAGEQLFDAVHRQYQELDGVINQLRAAQTETPLTVSVSTYFVTRWLSPRLGHFLNAHPDITVNLQHSVNDPDFALERTDIAIRWGDGNWRHSESQLLLPLPMIAVCSPALLDAAETTQTNPETPPATPLKTPDDLQHLSLLRDQVGVDYWAEWLQQAGVSGIEADGPVIVDPNVRVQSAIDGQGVALANPLLQPVIDAGLLCEPFDCRLEGYGYYLVYSKQATRTPQVLAFQAWLLEEAGRDN